MSGAKLISVTLLVAIAINLHSTNATCRLALPTSTGEVATTSMFSVMTGTIAANAAVVQTCAAACTACGGAVGTDAGGTGNTLGAAPAYDTIAKMTAFANSICPTISYTITQPAVAAGACPAGNPALGAPASQLPTNTIGTDTDDNAVGNMMSTGTSACLRTADAEEWTAPTGTGAFGALCPCLTNDAFAAISDACPVCGCGFFGAPTTAPTAIPTSAPTVADTTDSTSTTYTTTDNSLSGGAIAGIVIGSIVGAALVIGAGVMIGSK